MDKPCVHMGLVDLVRIGSAIWSTYEGDPIWNRTVPVSNQCRVNRVDPYDSGSEHTDPV